MGSERISQLFLFTQSQSQQFNGSHVPFPFASAFLEHVKFLSTSRKLKH